MARRSPALVVLGIGAMVVVAARLAFPSAPPLYDGVVPLEPYVWLDPPSGQPGGALGATADIAVRNGKSPLIAVATPESEPQAQIFAQPDSLTLPSGAQRINVAIEPVRSEGATTEGHIDGNVYRIGVSEENGRPLTAPASAQVTVVLRASDPTLAEATIARFSAGSWQPLKTSPAGFGGTFIAVVTEFGDFAVIAPGPGSSAPSTEGPTASAEPSVPALPGSFASAGQSSGSTLPPRPAATASGVPGWLLPGLVFAVIVFLVLGYRVARRARREPYRGAHRTRRR